MVLCRATFVFSQRKHGWTESLWRNSALIADQETYDACLRYAQKRIKLSGAQTFLEGFRRSEEGIFRDGITNFFPSGGLAGVAAQSSEDPATCLITRFRGPGFTRSKVLYLRGLWDSRVINGGVYAPDADYLAFFEQWASEIVAGGWGWYGKNVNVSGLLATVVEEVTGLVTLTTATNIFPAAGLQTIVRVTGAQGCENLNGALVVRSTGLNSCISLRRIPIFPHLPNTGKVTFQTKILQSTVRVDPIRIGVRKAGLPLYVSRGRR